MLAAALLARVVGHGRVRERGPHLEQRDVALAPLDVVPQGAEQPREEPRAQHGLVRRDGVRHPDPLVVVAHELGIGLSNHRRGPRLEGTEADQRRADLAPHRDDRGQRPGRGPGRHPRRQRGVAVEAGDLLGDVGDPEGRGAHVGPPGGRGHLEPTVDVAHREPDGREQPRDLVEPERHAESGLEVRGADGEHRGRGEHASSVHEPRRHAEVRAALGEQLGHPRLGALARHRVAAALEAHRGLRAPPVALGAAGDPHGVEPGRLEHDGARGLADLGRRAAHDPREPDGDVVAVADDEVLAGVAEHQGPLGELEDGAVEQLEGLAGDRTANREGGARQAVAVIGVGGLAELEHHVVGGVDDVVDRAHPAALEPEREPRRRGCDPDPLEDRRGEPPTQLGCVDPDRDELVGARRRGGRGRRRDGAERHRGARAEVPRDPLHAPGVGAVALDGDVEDRVGLDAQRREDRSSRGDPLGAVEHEQSLVVLAEAELAARAEHPVGDDAAQRAPGDRHPVGEHRADRRERHERADVVVPRAADHLDRPNPVADRREPDPVRALDRVDPLHLDDDDLVQPLADHARCPRRRGRGRPGSPRARRGRRGRRRSRASHDTGTRIRTASRSARRCR